MFLQSFDENLVEKMQYKTQFDRTMSPMTNMVKYSFFIGNTQLLETLLITAWMVKFELELDDVVPLFLSITRSKNACSQQEFHGVVNHFYR